MCKGFKNKSTSANFRMLILHILLFCANVDVSLLKIKIEYTLIQLIACICAWQILTNKRMYTFTCSLYVCI